MPSAVFLAILAALATPALADEAGKAAAKSSDWPAMLFVFMLATFIGLGVITRVSRLLAYAADVADQRDFGDRDGGGDRRRGGASIRCRSRFLGAIALFASTTNIVSGFLITDRMLKMFKQHRSSKQP